MSNFEKIAEIGKLVNSYPGYCGEPEFLQEMDAGGHNAAECYSIGIGDGESLLADKIKQILNS